MIRWNGMDILETLDELVDPKHTVLLMWDFAQNVVANAFNANSMTASTARLLQAARDRKVRTIYSYQNNMHLVGDTGAPTVRMRMIRANKAVGEILKVPPPVGPSPVPKIVADLAPREGDI